MAPADGAHGFIPPPDAEDPIIRSHLVGAGEQVRSKSQTERFGGPGIEDQFELGRLLYRQISRLCSLQNAIDEIGGPFHLCAQVNAETRESARLGKRRIIGNDREPGAQSQRRNLGGVSGEERLHDHSLCAVAFQGSKQLRIRHPQHAAPTEPIPSSRSCQR